MRIAFFKTNDRLQTLLYALGWGLAFAVPLLIELYSCVKSAAPFSWIHVVMGWNGLIPFALLFLIHNCLLLPILLKYDRKFIYITLTMCCIILTMLMIPEFHHMVEGLFNPDFHGRPKRHEPPQFMKVIFYLTNALFASFVVTMNLSLKLYFNARRNKDRIKNLEQEQVKSQLEYLKYQLNPHFFMNTLNNIHALIGIDPEQAQLTVIELSKLMRYLLYDADKGEVKLSCEIDFMKNYIELMRIRLTDKVSVTADFPSCPDNITVPPLLFITFIENAFKHGVSYRDDSIVAINMHLTDDKIHFSCANTVWPLKNKGDRGGVGLKNICKRLNLLFPQGESLLKVEATDNFFIVNLTIPLCYGNDSMHSH